MVYHRPRTKNTSHTHADKAIVIDYKFENQVVYTRKQLMIVCTIERNEFYSDINGYMHLRTKQIHLGHNSIT